MFLIWPESMRLCWASLYRQLRHIWLAPFVLYVFMYVSLNNNNNNNNHKIFHFDKSSDCNET